MQKIKAGGIIQNIGLAKIELKSATERPSGTAAVLRALGDREINIEFAIQSMDVNSRANMTFCVGMDDIDATLSTIEEVRKDFPIDKVTCHHNVAILSAFGPHFRDYPGVAALVFSSLTSAEINILATSTSISSVSCIVDHEQLAAAADCLKEAFELPESAVFVASQWSVYRSEPARRKAI